MRNKHTFSFTASQIEGAALAEAKYHREREAYWADEYAAAIATVRQTAKLEVREVAITGGMRAEMVVDYGDQAAYHRMVEAFGKYYVHRETAERYQSDARVYRTQSPDKLYELDTDDIYYYRLGGQAREE